MKENIFITGATGFVGTGIIQGLADEGFQITASYRHIRGILRKNIAWVQADLTDTENDLKRHLDSSSTLIHNAAVIPKTRTPEELRLLQLTNIDLTERLFDTAIACGIKRIIFTSGFNVIQKPLPSIITEESPTEVYEDPYAFSKIQGENYLKQKASQHNIAYSIFRISSPVSFSLEQMPQTVIRQWIEKSLKNENLKIHGSGGRTQDFVSLHDVAEAYKNCLIRGGSGLFNIASGTQLSMLELATLITQRFNNRFLHDEPDTNENIHWNISIAKAMKELGYSPQYSSKECIVQLFKKNKMRFAVLSDIHSNCFALEAVINEFVQYKIDRLIILGDIFGYYPWASKTYTLLMPFLGNAIAIKGNHDQLLLEIHPPSPEPSYWMAARQNENELKNLDPPALKWLHSLSFSSSVTIDRRKISLFHGTPQNASDGRYYPDDQKDYDWFPKTNEVILLGHTHYPLLRSTQDGGLIVNPGSVGQPRDGNPMPSWCILNTANFVFEHIRTNYNHLAAMEELKSLNWEPRSISALGKTSPGKLNF